MRPFFVSTALSTLLALCATGQTTTAPAPQSTGPVQTSALPAITFGAGTSWARGAANPLLESTNLAIQIKGTNWYSWTTVNTPIAAAPKGSAPLPSTITTGAAFVAAQSASGSVSLLFILQAGLAATQISTTGAFNGNVGAAFRLGKSHAYIMPYAGGASGTGGSLTSFVLQPGVMVLYGFGGKQ